MLWNSWQYSAYIARMQRLISVMMAGIVVFLARPSGLCDEALQPNLTIGLKAKIMLKSVQPFH
jgi:hypothetical protein